MAEEISFDELQKHFKMTQAQAMICLGVSRDEFVSIKKKYNIEKWPCRKLSAIDKLIFCCEKKLEDCSAKSKTTFEDLIKKCQKAKKKVLNCKTVDITKLQKIIKNDFYSNCDEDTDSDYNEICTSDNEDYYINENKKEDTKEKIKNTYNSSSQRKVVIENKTELNSCAKDNKYYNDHDKNYNDRRDDKRNNNHNDSRSDNYYDRRSDNYYDRHSDNNYDRHNDNHNDKRGDNYYDRHSDNNYDKHNDNHNDKRGDNYYDRHSDNNYDRHNDNHSDKRGDNYYDRYSDNNYDRHNDNHNNKRSENYYDKRSENYYDKCGDNNYDKCGDNNYDRRNDDDYEYEKINNRKRNYCVTYQQNINNNNKKIKYEEDNYNYNHNYNKKINYEEKDDNYDNILIKSKKNVGIKITKIVIRGKTEVISRKLSNNIDNALKNIGYDNTFIEKNVILNDNTIKNYTNDNTLCIIVINK